MTQHAIKHYIYEQGASLVGFASLKGDDLPGTQGFPYAISFACALPLEVVDELREGPTMAYYQEYREKNALINRIARGVAGLIKSAGYEVRVVGVTVKDTGQEGYIESFSKGFPHKTAATLSGLGWIGKSSLFISCEYGPRVRLGTVLTDMPLEVGNAISVGKCGSCMACIRACPVRAIHGEEWCVGMERDRLLDAYTCRKKAREFCAKLGIEDSLCGICIWACPVGKEELG